MISFLANTNIEKESQGMMEVVNCLDKYSKDEKHAILVNVFTTLYRYKLEGQYNLADLMSISNNIEVETKRTQIPEYGGAQRYIQGEL